MGHALSFSRGFFWGGSCTLVEFFFLLLPLRSPPETLVSASLTKENLVRESVSVL